MRRSKQRLVALLGTAAVIGGSLAVITAPPAEAEFLPEVRVGDVSIPEGNGTSVAKASVPIVMSSPASTTLCVEVTTGAPSTATGAPNTKVHDGSHDFVLKRGFRPIGTGKASIYHPAAILGDDDVEGNETLSVRIDSVRVRTTDKCLPTDPLASVRVARPTGTVTIIDDDPSAAQALTVGSVTIAESDEFNRLKATVPMSLSSPSPSTGLCVEWSVRSSRHKFARIPAGKTATKATVEVIGDVFVEGDEVYTVDIENVTLPNADGKCVLTGADAGVDVIGVPTVTVLDDDGPFAPENLTVTYQAPDTIVLSWSPPSFEGGAPVSGYAVQELIGNDTFLIEITTETSISLPCGAGNTCAYYVWSVNSHMWGWFVFVGPLDCC